MKTKALYAGSFDPIHFGHLDIIRRAAQHFDLTVLVADNPSKQYFLKLSERLRLVRQSIRLTMPEGLVVHSDSLSDPHKLTADYAFEHNIPVIVRGVRNFSDYDYEKMLREINISQQNGIETYFLSGDQKFGHLSSSAVKELFSHAGFIHEYVPLWVKEAMEVKNGLHIIGVTGNIASGKSWFCETMQSLTPCVYNVDLDKLAHEILFKSDLPIHAATRETIRLTFLTSMAPFVGYLGDPLDEDERKALGTFVFADAGKREKLNSIMYPPLMTSIRKAIHGKRGVVLLNGALLAECKLTHICNNNVVLITTGHELRKERLKERGLTDEQIKHRLQSQYTDERKKYHIEQAIKRDHHGEILEIDNSERNGDGPSTLLSKLRVTFLL